MKQTLLQRSWLLLLAFSLTVFSCQPNKDEGIEATSQVDIARYSADGFNQRTLPCIKYNAEIPIRWNEFYLKVSRFAPGYRPPASARALAYMGLAAWEASVPGHPANKSLARHHFKISIPVPASGSPYHWPTAVNAAYYQCFKYFFPHIKPELITEMGKTYADLKNLAIWQGIPHQAITNSDNFGKAVADAIIAWEKTDKEGYDAYKNPQPVDYAPPVGNFLWKPTPPDFSRAMFPTWGKCRTFAITQADKTGLPPSHYVGSLGSNTFMNQTREVYNRTNAAINGRNFEDKWIAEFWSDDIYELTFEPAARIISIGNQCLRQRGFGFWDAIELYAKTGLALSDNAVAVWHTKYIYNVERPVSTINRLIDAKWKPLLNNPIAKLNGVTPPFPAYPSGHSSFGGVNEVVFVNVLGDFGFVDFSHLGRTEFISKPRYFSSFRQAAEENAASRIPLGVHFRMDCEEGLRMGRQAARRVVNLPWH
jgi:PAP2 superfamily